MMSSARQARLGLGAVSLVFCLCIGVLGSKAIERRMEEANAAKDFVLREVDGQYTSLASLRGKNVLLIFWSARGPVTNEYARRVVRLANRYAGHEQVAVLAIDPTVDEVAPCVLDELRVFKSVIGQQFALLPDPGAKVAAQFGVHVTPTVLLIDKYGRIRYRGAFDDNQDEMLVKNHYCAAALASLMSERPIATTFTQAFGRPIGRPK